MIKIEITCDFCNRTWTAERYGDGSLSKFYIPSLDNKTACDKCITLAAQNLLNAFQS